MIKITKGREPEEWTALNATQGVTDYEPIHELRNALLRDQGYICAYCMRSIPVTKADPQQQETSKIEHIKSRQNNQNLQRRYSNMVICCPGFINSSSHCDKSKGNKEIHFSPFDRAVENSISYSTKDGQIRSSNALWNNDINDVICLNNPLLKLNRMNALTGVKILLSRKNYSSKILQEKLKEWNTPKEGRRKEYCGIVIWYLKRGLKTRP